MPEKSRDQKFQLTQIHGPRNREPAAAAAAAAVAAAGRSSRSKPQLNGKSSGRPHQAGSFFCTRRLTPSVRAR